MNDILRFETVNDYNVFNNNETLHPLVSVIDLSKAAPRQTQQYVFWILYHFFKRSKMWRFAHTGEIPTITRKAHWYLLHLAR